MIHILLRLQNQNATMENDQIARNTRAPADVIALSRSFADERIKIQLNQSNKITNFVAI